MRVPTTGLVFLEASALVTAASRGRLSKMGCNGLSYYTLRIECVHLVLPYRHLKRFFDS